MKNVVFLAVPAGPGVERASYSRDRGWRVERRLEGQDVRCLAANPLQAGVVYAGTQGDGLFVSRDGGESWQSLGLPGEVVKAIAVSPVSGAIYAGTRPAAMHRSDDQGQNWRELTGFARIPGRWLWFSPAESPWQAYVQAIAPSPTDADVVLAGIEFGAVVRSQDGGETWSRHKKGSLRDCHSMIFHASDGNWVYEAGGTGGGVAFSRDGGANWSKRGDGLDRSYGWACAADPAKPEVWYASLAPGPGKAHGPGPSDAFVYRAVGGASWKKLPIGGESSLDSMAYALLTDPTAPGHLYVGLADGTVWHTTDRGDSWDVAPFRFSSVRSCVLLPSERRT